MQVDENLPETFTFNGRIRAEFHDHEIRSGNKSFIAEVQFSWQRSQVDSLVFGTPTDQNLHRIEGFLRFEFLELE